MAWHWLSGLLVLLTGGTALAADRPATEEIGSWVLTCPQESRYAPCRLRHKTWIVPPTQGAPAAALEVLHRDGSFVPAIAVRGLTAKALALGTVVATQAQVGLRFDGGPRVELTCGLDTGSMVCTPPDTGGAAAATDLAAARSVMVQVRLELPTGTVLPDQLRALDLDRTADAVARFRATGPLSPIAPAVPGLDWRGLLERLARDAGWLKGAAANRGP